MDSISNSSSPDPNGNQFPSPPESNCNAVSLQPVTKDTVEERQSLKMSIIVKKVTQGIGPLTRAELVELAKSTDATYAIDDPVEQRKLLIELEEKVEVISYSTGSGGALHPVYP